jgi:hypothetical protein
MLKGHSTMAQSQLMFNPDGYIHAWQYNPDVARTQLCRPIAHLDSPLCFGESDAFEEYIKTAHKPRFSNVSRQINLNDRAQLVDCLKSVFFISLTSDIWSLSLR